MSFHPPKPHPTTQLLDPAPLRAEKDRLYHRALRLALEEGALSTILIQRHLSVGYARAIGLLERALAEGKLLRRGNRYLPAFTAEEIALENAGFADADAEEEALAEADALSSRLQAFLQSRGVSFRSVTYTVGAALATLTVHVSHVADKPDALAEELMLSESLASVRAYPHPEQEAIVFEIPLRHRRSVNLRELLESSVLAEAEPFSLPIGRDANGAPRYLRLSQLPHLLLVGPTGSGKTVLLHTFLTSLLLREDPALLRLLLVDVKRVELSCFADLPHNVLPPIGDPEEAAAALSGTVAEMEERYRLLSEVGARSIEDYNAMAETGDIPEKMPRLLVVVDELSDLLAVAPEETLAALCRLSQKSRTVGIHLILATQRTDEAALPSLLLSNLPARIVLGATTRLQSRRLLGTAGAERLLGRGDFLISTAAEPTPVRMQAPYVSLAEAERVCRAFRPSAQAYIAPPIELLAPPVGKVADPLRAGFNVDRLRHVLESNGVRVEEILCDRGPTVTAYTVFPDPATKVTKMLDLTDEIALQLSCERIRTQLDPAKTAIVYEIPNTERGIVSLRELLESKELAQASPLTVALGLDTRNAPVSTELSRLPHLLLAGGTGMGKSVMLQAILLSLLYRATPDEVRLLLIDPKRVELGAYRSIPHLALPVLSDTREAVCALRALLDEVDRRYSLLSDTGCRSLEAYNEANPERALPRIVVLIDELADLMLTERAELTALLCGLAQKSRAAGIHLILSTQRTSVDTLPAVLLANLPSRIAFRVPTAVGARLLELPDADCLLGRGDALFRPMYAAAPTRLQGAFVSDAEAETVCAFLREANAPFSPYSPLADRFSHHLNG